ncbi:MAG: BamA/TamA family outer membrane protein [Muribaculaceae bacterium]|nr:BamA/TamA family outer membrane protein [Muribaculaceae bacterium]
MKHSPLYLWLAVTVAILLTGCSASRHVPAGSYLLDKATIRVEDADDVQPSSLDSYLRQHPNTKVLGFAKLQLGVYNMSGRDTTKWYNRWIRRLGAPPVIYSRSLTDQSAHQLQLAMVNKGYTHATVRVDTILDDRKRKAKVEYVIKAGEPHMLRSVNYSIADTAVQRIVLADSASITLVPGGFFDRDNLDRERQRLTTLLRNNGYYSFTRDYITFVADTAAGSAAVDLEMVLRSPATSPGDTSATSAHQRYVINDVYFNTAAEAPARQPRDTVRSKGYYIIYANDRYIRPSILIEKCFLNPGDIYSAANVDRTYEGLSQLGILKFISINFTEAGTAPDGMERLNVEIGMSRTRTQTLQLQLEGTNSEGDLGVGAGLTYQHHNLAKHSELLTAKIHGSYESLSGNLEGLINDHFTEIGADVSITFPKFEAPILRRSYRQKVKASTEFNVSFNHQERPEYTRIIAGAGMKYKWANRSNTQRRTFDLIDINFVYLPKSTIDFINTIAPTNPLLRYSYEDHFIMRMGYSFYKTNRAAAAPMPGRHNAPQRDIYTLRLQAEMAGNLLYLISKATDMKRHEGAYKIFGIQYAQYLKGSASYTYNHFFNTRTSLALHADAGIAFPYGNSSMVPFEKRFYAGGANGVRGWSVRTLGPGAYDSRNSVTDFINQCGDISLFMSMEYRAKLFWRLEGALFVDAGNIWTIRDYETQPEGVFKWDKFYRQIALAYGAGIRVDFTYFLLRLDLGMKAHNPAVNQEPWPLTHPRWSRDASFHFSVGYPF